MQGQQQIIMKLGKTTNYSSQQSREDVQLARKLAQIIGLADHPPIVHNESPYISNVNHRRQRKRVMNRSDLVPYSKKQAAKEVRKRSKSKLQSQSHWIESTRKNSIKDIFVQSQRPEQRPTVQAQTQKTIQYNNMLRANIYRRQAQRLKLVSSEKERRASILSDVSSGLVQINGKAFQLSHKEGSWMVGGKRKGFSFGNTMVSKNRSSRSQSYQKLAVSLDFSKFNLTSAKGQMLLYAKMDQRLIHTAKTDRRSVRVHFNHNNKVELLTKQLMLQSDY